MHEIGNYVRNCALRLSFGQKSEHNYNHRGLSRQVWCLGVPITPSSEKNKKKFFGNGENSRDEDGVDPQNCRVRKNYFNSYTLQKRILGKETL